jgi:hypothetical protein
MFNFPRSAVVSIPASNALSGNCSVSVRIDTQGDIPRTKEFYGRRLSSFEIEAKSVNEIGLLQALKGERVRIMVADADIFERHEIIDALQALQPVFMLNVDGSLIRHINLLTSLNFRVHISASTPVQAEDTLLQAVDFYLHNPLLTIPIEPFHSLLHTVSRGKGYSLWDTESENVKTNYYVTDNGKVSLSRRWTENDLYYGALEDPWDGLINLKLYQRLAKFQVELFISKSPCIFCEHFDLCRGFLRAVVPEWLCGTWKEVFKMLRDEARKAMELQEGIG